MYCELFVNMFWLLVILTTVFCAPVTQDPEAVGTINNGIQDLEEVVNTTAENNYISEDDLAIILRKLIETNYLSAKVNKIKEDCFESDLIETFLNYDGSLPNRNDGTRERLNEMSVLNIFNPDAISILNEIFDYIEGNYRYIWKELGFVVPVDDNNDLIEEDVPIYKQAVISGENAATIAGDGDSLLPNSADKSKRDAIYDDGFYISSISSKDAPLVDTGIDWVIQQYPSIESSYLSLKTIYEKRGGVCTLINGYSKNPIYVISTCPWKEIPANIKQLCENIPQFSKRSNEDTIIDIAITPVQDPEGFVYKNVYCAQCNDVTSVIAWSTQLECNYLQPVEFSDGREKIIFMDEFTDRNNGCYRLVRPPTVNNQMVHECSHVDVINVMGHRIHQTRIGVAPKADVSPFPLSFSILMNFGFDGKTHILFSTTPDAQMVSMMCGKNEMYDPVNEKCRTITCYDGYQLVDGKCQQLSNIGSDPTVDDLSSLSDMEYPVQVVLTLNNITGADYMLLFIPSIEDLMVLDLAQTLAISFDRIQNLTLSFDNTSGQAIEIMRLTTPGHPKTFSNEELVKPTTGTVPPESIVSEIEGDDEEVVSEAVESTVENVHIVNESNNNIPSPTKTNDSLEKAVESTPRAATREPDNFEQEFWTKPTNISVRISFILNPAHHDKTLIEKSVKNVVQSINNLINTNSFMLTINGTNLQVQGFQDEGFQDVNSMDMFCQKGFQVYQDRFALISHLDKEKGINITSIYVNETGSIYYPGQYDLTLSVDGVVGNLSRTEVNQFAFVCVMPKLVDVKCGRIVLNKSEYVLLHDKTLSFADHVYNASEFEYENEKLETVRVCAPDWSTAQMIYNKGQWGSVCGEDLLILVQAESYLTFILGVISLVSMLSVLITYGLLERLRNLPGINTINLTLSLFLGELLFITSGWIQPHQAWLCSAVGMVLHYFFLASFFWMNVMSFDVYRTFARKCILRRIRDKRTYAPRYALYAWGGPLLIVSVCALLDFSKLVDGVEVGYGGSSSVSTASETVAETNDNSTSAEINKHVYSIGCWIQNPVASMAAFGGPMMLILLSNVVMFTRTIICIRASTKSTRLSVRRSSLSHMTGHDDVMLYIRMSTVMGFTWIFGLASSVVSAFAGSPSKTTCIILHLLGILFIVFNCSQGLFIFFAFVFSRRVLALYKGLIQSMKNRKRPLSSSSSSRGTLTTNASQSSLSHIS